MDELIKQARAELEPPWDDLREARVLARVLEQDAPPRRSWRGVLLAAGAATVVLALALLWLRGGAEPAPTLTAPASALRAPEPMAQPAASVLALADGSKAHLKPGAEVLALEQSTARVRLLQPAGEVRYDVRPDPKRPFTVLASGVEVEVLGTLFTVAVEAEGVRVNVERGRVSVRNGARAVDLTAGESVRLSRGEPGTAPPTSAAGTPPPMPGDLVAAPAPSEKTLETPEALLARADRARAAGDLAAAESALRRLVSEHAASPKATSATFSLGRVQSARGNFSAAARTFETLRRRAPAGPLAEDALAEAANAWALAGSSGQSRALAAEYLARYPGGPHAERMKRLGRK